MSFSAWQSSLSQWCVPSGASARPSRPGTIGSLPLDRRVATPTEITLIVAQYVVPLSGLGLVLANDDWC